MDTQTASTAGAVAAAFAFGAWGWFQAQKAKRAEEKKEEVTKINADDLNKSSTALAESYKSMADDWKERYETERQDSVNYHQFVHDKAQKDNSILLNLTEENALLRARTDLKPIIEHMDKQSVQNQNVAVALEKLTGAVGDLVNQIAEKLK